MNQSISLKDIALVFLKLGTITFGGPAATISMMEDEIVHRKTWLTREEFLDLIGITNLIPGPNSTEISIHIGHRLAGWKGLLIAGICFISPAVLIVTCFAWTYVRYGTLPEIEIILSGIKPVIVTIILLALFRFGQSAIKTKSLCLIAVIATITYSLGVSEILVIFAAGFLNLIFKNLKKITTSSKSLAYLFVGTQLTSNTNFIINPNNPTDFSLIKLFMFFVKVSSILFGSGYVLLAFLKADLVDKFGWLTEAQLLDAIAVGQFTPGPLFTTATFIGYILAGFPGAIVATVGIFLPAFFFVAITAPFVNRIRQSKNVSTILDGINIASLALMAVVTFTIGKTILINFLSLGIFSFSLILLTKFKINPIWLIISGGIVAAFYQNY
jgi:chromate transporter